MYCPVPDTSTGTFVSHRDPAPSWPLELVPQHQMLPSNVSPKLCREPASAGESVRLLASDGRLVAIAVQDGPGRSGILHPRIVLERPTSGANRRSPLQRGGGRLT